LAMAKSRMSSSVLNSIDSPFSGSRGQGVQA
jgi:hypothetical protein